MSDSRPVSPLTVRLGKGRHRSPRRAVCVMELSSMLAAEQFSDHPSTVCPVLAAFLRAYNDHLPPRLRQHLYPWASEAVGTRDLQREVIAGRRAALCAMADSMSWVARRRWWDRCLCAYADVTSAGIHCARVVCLRPELHSHVDEALRNLYERPLAEVPAPPAPVPDPVPTPMPPGPDPVPPAPTPEPSPLPPDPNPAPI